MTVQKKMQAAEAIIFASGDGVSIDVLKNVLELGETELKIILSSIEEKYNDENSGIKFSKSGDTVSFTTNPETADIVYTALSVKKNTPLSNAAMETLAIIAYNQPVSKAFIEQVRGVDSSSSIQTLVTRDLVEEAGRLEIPGRPISYKTTDLFLKSFSLNSLSDLPEIKTDVDTSEEDENDDIY